MQTRKRTRRLGCGWLAGLAAGTLLPLLMSAPAHADRSFDVAMAAPAIDPYGLVVVDRARMPQRFEFGMQAYFGWAHAPLQVTLTDPLYSYSDRPYQLIGNQLTVDLGFYFGLWDFLSIAAVMPMGVNYYDQNAVGSPAVPQLPSASNPTGSTIATGLYRGQPKQTVGISSSGVRDPRVAVKARFYGGKSLELGTILEATLPLGDSASFFADSGPTFRPRLLGGFQIGRLAIVASFGGIIRSASELDDPPYSPPMPATAPTIRRFEVGSELTWGGGLNVVAFRALSLGLEAFGTIPVAAGAGDPVSATATMLGSLAIRPGEQWSITVAGGGGLLTGSARNADGRILIGLAYSVSPREGGLR